MNDKERIGDTIGRLATYAYSGVFECAQDDIQHLIDNFLLLEDQAAQADAWEGRYNALLEECENPRPREYVGNGRDLAYGSVVIDREGDAWQRYAHGGWSCYMVEALGALPAKHAPYTIVYTPKEES